jgi:RNA polymerase sigma factor (sigma-70 family)
LDDASQQALALLEEHGPRLHALLFRVTLREDVAEDLLQDLFVRLSRRPLNSRAREPLAYAVAAATRLAFDWRRSQRRRHDVASLHCDVPDESPPIDRKLDEREDLQSVLDAIDRLPASLRTVVVMRYLENRSYDEIAALLGKPPHHVRAVCHKAIVRLRTLTRAQRIS